MDANQGGDAEEVTLKYTDRKMCRLFLAGLCPHELFPLAKLEKGRCPKVHSLQLRKEYEEAKAKGVDNYDIVLEDNIERLIIECDREIERTLRGDKKYAKAAIAISVAEVTQTPKMIELSKQIREKLKKADQFDLEGKTLEKIKAIEEVDKLISKRAEKQLKLYLHAFNKDHSSVPQPLTNADSQQTDHICDICGASLRVYGRDPGLLDHFGGKLHLAYMIIREKLVELQRLYHYNTEHLSLYKHVVSGLWDRTKPILTKNPSYTWTPITESGETVLHVALNARVSSSFISKLLNEMSARAIMMADAEGYTGLHLAVITNEVDAVSVMADRCPLVVLKATTRDCEMPIQTAARYKRTAMVRCLMNVMMKNKAGIHIRQEVFVRVLCSLVRCRYYGYAKDLVDQSKYLVNVKTPSGDAALVILAHQASIFNSEQNRLQGWLQKYVCSCFMRVAPNCPKFIEDVFHSKLPNKQARVLLSTMCRKMDPSSYEGVSTIFKEALLVAVARGNCEVVKEILLRYPLAAEAITADTKHGIVEVAILNRQSDVIILISSLRACLNLKLHRIDASKNTILHLVARLGPVEKLRNFSGPVHQLQYELKWYKGVKKFIGTISEEIEEVRNEAGKTAWEVFEEEHKEPFERAQAWTQYAAAGSLMIIGLILAIIVGCILHPPGGYNDKGKPIFISLTDFSVAGASFGISFVMGLISVITSITLMKPTGMKGFVDIVPYRLNACFYTLILALVFMVFGIDEVASMLYEEKHSRVTVSCVVITAFAALFYMVHEIALYWWDAMLISSQVELEGFL